MRAKELIPGTLVLLNGQLARVQELYCGLWMIQECKGVVVPITEIEPGTAAAMMGQQVIPFVRHDPNGDNGGNGGKPAGPKLAGGTNGS